MKLLLVQTGFIGDVILSTPVVHALRALYPEAEITLVTTPQAAPLFGADTTLSQVLTFDKRGAERGVRGLLRMAKRLRAHGFTMAVSLHKSYRTAALLALAGIPVRIGFREAAASFLYTLRAPRKDLPHEALRNLAILRGLGHEPDRFDPSLRLEPGEEERRAAEELLGGGTRQLIGIAPGSVWATKRWTIEGFGEVAASLVNDGYKVVLIGGPEDAPLGTAICDRVKAPIINLIGKTGLAVSAAVVERLSLLITNDSAPLHLASAARTPTVAVFCATVPEFGYGPWQTPHEIVEVSGLSCRPCGRHGGQQCPTGTHACQREISSAMVLAAVRRLLTPAGRSLLWLRTGQATSS